MNRPLSTHRSYWLSRTPLRSRFRPLTEVHRSDVAIIGAGITGLSIALELLHRGLSVAVYEASVIGAGTTGGSSGHLDALPEDGAWRTLDRLGAEQGTSYVNLRQQAISAIEHRADESCEFRRVPGYRYSEDSGDEPILRRELEAALKLGLRGEWQNSVPFPRASLGFRIEQMARLDTMAYLQRLATLVEDSGGIIFEQTQVEAPTGSRPSRLQAGKGTAEFLNVVCATHSNFSDVLTLDVRIPAYQSYVLAARVADPPPDALYWDHADPYHYTRYDDASGEGVLLIGGCDHRTGDGDPADSHRRLEEYSRERFQVEQIVSRWSAEFFDPADALPLIGRMPGKENVWVATGLSGVGLTWGTASGWLIADQIHGQKSELQDLLSPARLTAKGMFGTVREQLTPLKSYARHVLPADPIDPAELKPGAGAVGMVDGQHTAICRDLEGELHRCSPVCSHMGGIVSWNEAEQSWDCPVHGGRFTKEGHRLYGPPCQALKSNSESPAS